MKGDFSRDTYAPRNRFSRVLMQQGRVLVDADWNEQTAILLHYIRTLTADIIGPHGGPDGASGFGISVDSASLTAADKQRLGFDENEVLSAGDFLIGPGHYYVGGLLAECPEVVTYFTQRDFVVPDAAKPAANAVYLVYLDVWERHLTAVEDHLLREVALGGPDTASRAQVLAQVKTVAVDDDFDFDKVQPGNIIGHNPAYSAAEQRALLEIVLMTMLQELKGIKKVGDRDTFIKNRITPFRTALHAAGVVGLKARAYVPQVSVDPCTIQPDARYRGPENQLYRVEVHRAGSGSDDNKDTAPTFKWSRENGCVVFPIDKVSESTVTLANLGRDARFGLQVGNWVEVVSDDSVLQNRADPLLRVTKIEHLDVTLDGTIPGPKSRRHRLLRRWDQRDPKVTMSGGAVVIVEGQEDSGWFALEDGVQVQFQKPPNNAPPHQYRTGDYWLIPARTATGDVEWPGPSDKPHALPPRGVAHHVAPIARIRSDNQGKIKPPVAADDLRLIFESLP